jgi:hypothetical protein
MFDFAIAVVSSTLAIQACFGGYVTSQYAVSFLAFPLLGVLVLRLSGLTVVTACLTGNPIATTRGSPGSGHGCASGRVTSRRSSSTCFAVRCHW